MRSLRTAVWWITLTLTGIVALMAPAIRPSPRILRSATPDNEPVRTATHPSSTQAAWQAPVAPGSAEVVEQRQEMVQLQISQPTDGRQPVTDPATLEAMRNVPRHEFVPEDLARDAYRDTPLPIGHGQTISQPYIVALMTELLALKPGEKVLEIGTGSGYQAAVLGQITPHVYSIEIIDDLAKQSAKALAEQNCRHVQVRQGDGYFGWKEAAPFDAIIVTCAAGHLPAPLWEQLAPGGRVVVPIGGAFDVQRLVLITKTPEGKRRSRTFGDVRFVPMTGRIEKAP